MAGSLLPQPKQLVQDNAWNPGVAYKIYTYAAGTLTPKATYEDMALTVENTNPVIANARGEVVMYGEGRYRVILKDSLDNLIWDRDNVETQGYRVDQVIADLAAAGGAGMVGITDAAGNYAGSTVEAALAEIWTKLSSTVSTIGASLIGFIQSGTGAVARTVLDKLRETQVNVMDFGADSTGASFSTTAIQNAIQSLRANAVSITDTIGGNTITAYSSGTVVFPRGVFKIAPDVLKIYQDLGLTLKGQGSRRTNNAVRAATTILISGTSSGFGIQAYRSGGRGLTIEDMDVCYETSAFTGSVLDIVDCPGVTLNRVFLGTNGLTGATRLQSAAACIRATYDEFLTANNCVFDGAVDGVWFDDARTELGNTFGGANSSFNECVWYDFTGNHVRHDGNRTRTGVSFKVCAFNPISVNCTRAVSLTNIEGLSIDTCHFVPSTTYKATTEWLLAANCTGSIVNSQFDDFSKAGTISGQMRVDANRVYGTDGFTLTGGVIGGCANEFSKCSNGWTVSPSYMVCADLGPDLFKSDVTTSYNIPADSIYLSVRVNYSSDNDSSTAGIANASARVVIENTDGKQLSVADAAYVPSKKTDTGRTVLAIGGSAQTFTLPTPSHGIRFRFVKLSAAGFRVDASVANTLYVGTGGGKTSVVATNAADVGGSVEFEAYGTSGYIVRWHGNWTLS